MGPTPAQATRLRLRRQASPVLPREAYAQSAELYPYMLAREWTQGAHWEIPADDLAAFGGVCEGLLQRATRSAAVALQSDAALEALALGEVRDLLRRSLARGDRSLIVRFDFALAPVPGEADSYVPWLLELNGDTPGNVLEAAVMQREWGQASGRATAGDTLEEQVAAIFPPGLTVLHHPGDPYIVNHARWFARLSPGGRCVTYPEVPPADAGPVYKMFRWGRLWAGRFPEVGAWAAQREQGISEPAWGALLQHKGLLARLWDEHPGLPHLLPATLEGPQALPDGGASGWAHKSFHGVSGAEVAVVGPGETEAEPAAGGVWQARVPPLQVDGLYPILCAVMVGGRFAGAIVREDDTPISLDDIAAPLAVLP